MQIAQNDPLHVRITLESKGEIVFKAATEDEAKLWMAGMQEAVSKGTKP
jgi:hypothetical protein